ncbi:MAG: thiamine-phosphate kinase [Pseudomonadota bacterium]
MSDGGEFGYIARRLAPLAGKGALGLLDDAALIEPPAGERLLVSADTLVAGRHFLIEDGLRLAARRALRVNLSDLAAMAARPLGYLCCVTWPDEASDSDRAAFAEGLAEDQALFGVSLLGGDTTRGPGPLTITITVLGSAPAGKAVLRSGAQPGDVLLVTGAIGDGRLGLQAALGELDIDADEARALRQRYRLPDPRLEAGKALQRFANAAVDVSDGLIADAGHLALASGLALDIDLEAVRLSDAARSWRVRRPDPVVATAWLASGGDDYELACAVAPADVEGFMAACQAVDLPATPLGAFSHGKGVSTRWGAEPVKVDRAGFTHF